VSLAILPHLQSEQHQPKDGETNFVNSNSLNKNVNKSHMDVLNDRNGNNAANKGSDDYTEEEDVGIYEDNDKSGSDEDSLDNNDNSLIERKDEGMYLYVYVYVYKYIYV
jgi:hypothetical protein